jgi:predicted nucleic acid-binding protein
VGLTLIYLDANIIIRLVEGDVGARHSVEARLRGLLSFMTSRLSRLECRCRPLREGDQRLLGLYETFFNGSELSLCDVTAEVIERATELRAKLNVRTPDAIHLASAVLYGVTVFLTGDRSLVGCTAVPVEIV